MHANPPNRPHTEAGESPPRQAFYNENDPFAAAWLRELIAAGLIAPGVVDERSIKELTEADLDGYTQCHFFAGIGGWPLALRLAGWPDGRPVWTGSCPCQPFSLCGDNAGTADPRDLWPDFARLIRKSKPRTIFGEQVENAIRWGWLDRLCVDLEAEGYAVGPAVLPADAVGARHRRDRLWWVASADAASFDGQAHDRVGESGDRRPSIEPRRLPRVPLAGRWWVPHEGAERLPTLVQQFNGLSRILGGFGNAIVPELAAEFVTAYCEVAGFDPRENYAHSRARDLQRKAVPSAA